MDYGKLPPEINSVRMYSGSGAASLRAAATAWDGLSRKLREAATSAHATTVALSAGWQGEALAAHVGWLNSTAAQCEQTVTQARAAAGAYEAARVATVPPQMVGANRTLRMSLAAANWLGQNMPAIAAAEADYERMWAQDAAAMYAYARACADASAIPPFVPCPTDAGSVSGQGSGAEPSDQDVIAVGAQITSLLPQTLRALASANSEGFNTALSATAPALARMSSLRLGFAREASVLVAAAIRAQPSKSSATARKFVRDCAANVRLDRFRCRGPGARSWRQEVPHPNATASPRRSGDG